MKEEIKINPLVDKYLIDGCMRCKYGGTAHCKVLKWTSELETLRQLALETGLREEIKWGVPVYTLEGKNIITINALKDSANIGFYKGAILKDEAQILEQQGNIQAARIVRFANVGEIEKVKHVLETYIQEAISLEKQGKKVETVKNPEPIPGELSQAFEEDELFKNAFESLTLGRQRGYIIHFSQPKQSATRKSRIQKYKSQILEGIGLHDHYKK
ncbi:YdeI family protein [Belliella kenyensis]|uniref:YdeI family protein n=1 Tax=Belliella kenyensis TaxID=1472724 RepID=A0ABV8EN29_9BACT|nr:DUF1801 domain-containing protein [Belliella kenyensis]MCH7403522.1 DUF1801 domain-containing protein [Belliella kenyensis]MDN3604956.1 DUF1801 domain-containing protein [Belliella kenyensis]